MLAILFERPRELKVGDAGVLALDATLVKQEAVVEEIERDVRHAEPRVDRPWRFDALNSATFAAPLTHICSQSQLSDVDWPKLYSAARTHLNHSLNFLAKCIGQR
jgi:hypothetical protein